MQRSGRAGRRRLVLLAGLVLPVVAVAGLLLRSGGEVLRTVPLPAVAAPAAAAAPASMPAAEPDGQTIRLVAGGRSRSVLVQSPLAGQAAVGVVVVLGPHGLSMARTAQDLRFDDLRSRGYAVAYPSTVAGDWNAGRCCGASQRAAVDDVGFLQDVRRLLEQRFSLPARSVGLVGYSTGGQMAYRLLCEHPTYAHAVVVVAGSLESGCAPSRPLPALLVVHGMQDSTVPWDRPHRTGLLDYAPTPFHTTITELAAVGGCGRRTTDTSDGRELTGWDGCTGIASLTAVGMPRTGHGWTPLAGSVYATRFLPDHLGR